MRACVYCTTLLIKLIACLDSDSVADTDGRRAFHWRRDLEEIIISLRNTGTWKRKKMFIATSDGGGRRNRVRKLRSSNNERYGRSSNFVR